MWLERLGIIEETPFKHIKNLKLPQKVVNPFTPEEIRKLLDADFPTPYLAARNRAIIWLFLDTGIRLNELNSLNLEDLDITHHRLRILNGKMRKQRVVGLGDAVVAALKEYLKVCGDQPGRLFLSKRMKPMAKHAIQVMLRRLAQRAGVSSANPHCFRHTFATWALEAEARTLDVPLLLGHSTPAMVRRYAATSNTEKVAQAHARWSRGDRLGLTQS